MSMHSDTSALSGRPIVPAAVPEIPGRCYRCGNPTRSPDVGLCENCNPTGIAGPTATQVHGLILAAVAGALITMAIVAKILISGTGPFPATVVGQAAYPDGTVDVVVQITNGGSSTTRPTCTIVRGSGDLGVEFLAERIEPGATVQVAERVPALPAGSSSSLATVTCQ